MKNILFVLIGIISLTACEKKKNNIHGDIGRRREILVSRNWQLVGATVNDRPLDIKSCQRDNYFVFEDNGFGRWEEGANNCFGVDYYDSTSNPEMPPVLITVPKYTGFNWSMTSDQRYIYIKDLGLENYDPEWEILNMDYTSLDVKNIERVGDSLYTYKRYFRVY